MYGEVPYCNVFNCTIAAYTTPLMPNQSFVNACQLRAMESTEHFNETYEGNEFFIRHIDVPEVRLKLNDVLGVWSSIPYNFPSNELH